MPLTLVLGPANSAKAGEVLGAYALAARRDALLVVPTAADVAHYERELAAPGVTLGRTLTFPGLIEEMALRARHRRTRLTPLQRERVMRRAIASLRLGSLSGSAAGGGFARAAGRLIAELEQERVSPPRFTSALRQWAGAAPDRVAYARELAAIYRRYQEELARLDRVDAEMFAWGALDALRERPARWGGTPVFFYGFDDLTPIELDTIETLSRQAEAAVTVSLTYEPDRPALAARATVVEELRASAQSVSRLPALEEYYAPAARTALHHLERHLFEADPPVVDPGDAVALMEAGGERAEAELVAAGVLAALGDGVPAEEIVLVCRSLNGSGELFERELAHHGVAATSARQLPLEHTALGRALLALTRCALLPAPQRSVEDLIAYLRHPGLVEVADALDRLEADLRRHGTQRASTAQTREPALRPALNALEELRRERDPAAALPDHVRRLLASPFRATARLLSAAEQLDARAATAVLSALAELEQLDEGRALPAELIELLEGLVVPAHGPAPVGAVLVAEPLSIRARRFRHVFVTGLCEGEFPAAQTVSRDPFLSDERRRELALASGLALPPPGDPLDRERYLLYACVSRATERVSFSYRSSDEEGNVVMASPFLEDIAELFPGSWRERRRRRLLADVVWSVEEAPSEWERVVAGAGGEGAPPAPPPPHHPLPRHRRRASRHAHTLRAGAGPRAPPPDRLRRCAGDVRGLPREVAGRAPVRRQ
jgi:superfamily I DNA/RNA helicase